MRLYRILLRAAALLLCAALLAAASGCGAKDDTLKEREQLIEELYGSVELEGSGDTNTGDATTSNFVLPYTRGDTLNPYMCESMLDAAITDLIYNKILRNKTILQNHGQTIVSEGVEGNYFDMVNYAVFNLIKIEEQNNNK